MISAIISSAMVPYSPSPSPTMVGRDRLHHADRRGRPGEHRGERHHDQDQRGEFARLHQHLVDVAQGERAIDEEADEEAVEHRHHGGFRRRERADPHAAEDHDRRQQAPERLLEALPQPRALFAPSPCRRSP
jgi:hypothetical protein